MRDTIIYWKKQNFIIKAYISFQIFSLLKKKLLQTSASGANVADREQLTFHCDFLITSPLKNYKPQTPKSVISITTTRPQITPNLNIRKNIFSDSEKHSTPIQNQHSETLDLHKASLTSNEDVSVKDASVLDSTHRPEMMDVMDDRNYF